MKNYIANERGDWATSTAYIKSSLSKCIHHGRLYASGRGNKEQNLYEALRLLGQALHTLEDFGAHSNYVELALREMGFRNVFPHVGSATEINVRGRTIFPLVTGTFGMVDFLHSVLGEADDKLTQSELDAMDIQLGNASSGSADGPFNSFVGLLDKVPGTKDLVDEAENLRRASQAQAQSNRSRNVRTGTSRSGYSQSRGFGGDSSYERERGYGGHSGYGHASDYYGSSSHEYGSGRERESRPAPSNTEDNTPAMADFDAEKIVKQIYPILEFRDKVVRTVSSIIEKIPGLEALVEKISESVTIYVFSLLAPYIRPLVAAASQSMQAGSNGVLQAAAKHQFEPWNNPHCTDPTHSMLSKDHFANILNEVAGAVAAEIVKYVVPRVVYAWEHPDVPEERVLDDVARIFHHPALRDRNHEAHRLMFEAVERWVQSRPDRGRDLDDILSAEGIREGKNIRKDQEGGGHSHGGGGFSSMGGTPAGGQYGSHGGTSDSQQQRPPSGSSNPLEQLSKLPGVGDTPLGGALSAAAAIVGGLTGEGSGRKEDKQEHKPSYSSHEYQSSQSGGYHQSSHQSSQYESGYGSSRYDEGPNYSSSHHSRPQYGHSSDYYGSSQSSRPSQYGQGSDYSSSRPSGYGSQSYYQSETSYSTPQSHGYQDTGYSPSYQSSGYERRHEATSSRYERSPGRSGYDDGYQRSHDEYSRPHYDYESSDYDRRHGYESRQEYGRQQEYGSYERDSRKERHGHRHHSKDSEDDSGDSEDEYGRRRKHKHKHKKHHDSDDDDDRGHHHHHHRRRSDDDDDDGKYYRRY